MKKLHSVTDSHDPEHEEFTFFCPGCKCGHRFITRWGPKNLAHRKGMQERGAPPPGSPPVWAFNRDMERPTFSPSLVYFREGNVPRCHLHLVAGVIQFLGDCEHEFAGKSVPLEEW